MLVGLIQERKTAGQSIVEEQRVEMARRDLEIEGVAIELKIANSAVKQFERATDSWE